MPLQSQWSPIEKPLLAARLARPVGGSGRGAWSPV